MGPGEIDLSFQDSNGMTAMHHACRAMNMAWVRQILMLHREACNTLTWTMRTPGRWSPLQCLVDNACPPNGEGRFADLTRLVASNTSMDILFNQTSTGNTVFHQVASRGHHFLVDILVERFDNRAAEAINIKNYAVDNRPDTH